MKSEVRTEVRDLLMDMLGHEGCERGQASNLVVIKYVVDKAKRVHGDEFTEQLNDVTNHIKDYESRYPEVLTTQFHFVKVERPNGRMRLLSFDEAVYYLV